MGNFHIDFIPLGIFGFVYDIVSFVMFCFGFLFAIGFFPNTVVGPWGVLVMYLKSYQGFNKKKKKNLHPPPNPKPSLHVQCLMSTHPNQFERPGIRKREKKCKQVSGPRGSVWGIRGDGSGWGCTRVQG